MNRDEILSKAQNESGAYDERERLIHMKSSSIGKVIGLLLGFVFVWIELIFVKKAPVVSMGILSVCFCMNAFESWYRFAFLKGKYNLIRGILYSVFSVAFGVFLIHFLFKV